MNWVSGYNDKEKETSSKNTEGVKLAKLGDLLHAGKKAENSLAQLSGL